MVGSGMNRLGADRPPVRIGVVGCGNVMQGVYMPMIERLKSRGLAEAVAACDVSEAARALVRERWGIERFSTTAYCLFRPAQSASKHAMDLWVEVRRAGWSDAKPVSLGFLMRTREQTLMKWLSLGRFVPENVLIVLRRTLVEYPSSISPRWALWGERSPFLRGSFAEERVSAWSLSRPE